MVDDVVKSFSLLKELLLSWKGERKEKTDAIRKAIITVEKATLATRAYLARIRNKPEAAAYTHESALSQLWFEAYSRCLEAGHHDLARRCQIKAHGWVDAKIWDDPRYAGIAISLESILDSCRGITATLPKHDA